MVATTCPDDALPWQDDGFARATLSSIPFQDDMPEKERLYIREAFVGLSNIFGYSAPTTRIFMPDSVKQGVLILVERAGSMASVLSLPDVKW